MSKFSIVAAPIPSDPAFANIYNRDGVNFIETDTSKEYEAAAFVKSWHSERKIQEGDLANAWADTGARMTALAKLTASNSLTAPQSKFANRLLAEYMAGDTATTLKSVTAALTNPQTPPQVIAALGPDVIPYQRADSARGAIRAVDVNIQASIGNLVAPKPAKPAPGPPPSGSGPKSTAGGASKKGKGEKKTVDYAALTKTAAAMVLTEFTALTPAVLRSVLSTFGDDQLGFYAVVFTGASRGVRDNTDKMLRLVSQEGGAIPAAFTTDRGVNHSACAAAGHMIFQGAPSSVLFPAGSLADAYAQSLPDKAHKLGDVIINRGISTDRSTLMVQWRERASTWPVDDLEALWDIMGDYVLEISAGNAEVRMVELPEDVPATLSEVAAARAPRLGPVGTGGRF